MRGHGDILGSRRRYRLRHLAYSAVGRSPTASARVVEQRDRPWQGLWTNYIDAKVVILKNGAAQMIRATISEVKDGMIGRNRLY